MKEFLRLIKIEFIKNTTIKRVIVTLITLILSSLIIFKISKTVNPTSDSLNINIDTLSVDLKKQEYENALNNFNENQNYETELELKIKEKNLKLEETLYSNNVKVEGFLSRNIYSNINNLTEQFVLCEKENNDCKELNQEYDILVDTLMTKDLTKLEEFNIKNYKKELSTLGDSIQDKINKYYYEENIKLSNYIIDNKITLEDNWKNYIIYHYKTSLLVILNYNNYFVNEDTFNEQRLEYINYDSYEEYVDDKLKHINIEKSKIELYKNILKQDIKPIIKDEYYNKYDIRIGFSNIYYMGIIVIIICTILFSGVVAKEHNTGSIRLLLANPFKRSKVLLSKFVYIILNALILYIISLLIFLAIMFITGNGDSLSIPQLIIEESNVTQTNYLLFIIKNMGIHFIFITLILTLLFFISTVSLNTGFTVSISLITTIVFSFLPILIKQTLMYIFNFIPFTYINYASYLSSSPLYKLTNLSNDEGIINIYSDLDINISIVISIIFIVVLFILNNLIYKRDIKN
ncbi:MAG: ABC transporter permease [Clostridium sp.]|nr:ABC transporter permease [Clostridium sp.]MCM1443984.1 ABC transporter permease [Candidatus Amulumruptor caecigallinarius]